MGLGDLLRRGGRAPDDGPYAYPLERSNDRHLDGDYDGPLFVWDIDKTYLVSEFDSFKGLLTIPFELAVDKRAIAGTDVLLRALRAGPGQAHASHPLYFISASPPQLRKAIQGKMLMDGVEFDGITFKDQLAILRSRKVGRIKEQVGYKLSALLRNRQELPWGAREFLFGDDSEADAVIYALYADIVAGRLRGSDLDATLRGLGVDPEDAAYVTELSLNLPRAELVQRIYIHLEKRTSPSAFAPWGDLLVPCFDTLQMALHLHQQALVTPQAVYDVAANLVHVHGRAPVALLRSIVDMLERRRLDPEALAPVWDGLRSRTLLPGYVAFDLEAAADRAPVEARPAGDFRTPLEHLALTKPRV